MNAALRPALWGVLNVTPDSFSDGGAYLDPRRALDHAHQMVAEGASVIDVGGESTRPGADRISATEEQSRIMPLIESLVAEGITVSVDTMRASTAALALEAGAQIINDVSGGLADLEMFPVIAGARCDYVLMHWRGHSDTMDSLANYDDVVRDVGSELLERTTVAISAGIEASRIIVDPGLGFAKTPEHNWALLHDLSALVKPGQRMVVGASRKRFLGALLPPGHRPTERDALSATLGVLLADQGVWALRVHNVAAHREALDVWQAVGHGNFDA